MAKLFIVSTDPAFAGFEPAIPVRRAVWGLAVFLATLGCGKETSPPGDETDPVETSSSQPASESTLASDPLPDDTAPLFNAMPPSVSATAAPGSTADVSNARLQTCIPTTGPGENPLLDDFEDEDMDLPPNDGRFGRWYSYENLVGDHKTEVAQLDQPRLQSHWAAHSSSTYHGEWAGFGVTFSDCVYDVSSFVGLHLWIRGAPASVDVTLQPPGVIPLSEGGTCDEVEGPCWDGFRMTVNVTDQWREYFLPFKNFAQLGFGLDAGELDLTRIRSLEFQSNSGMFDYWVDDVSFYIDEVYTPLPEPSDAGTPATTAGPDAEVDGGASDPPSNDAGLPPLTDAATTLDAGSDGSLL